MTTIAYKNGVMAADSKMTCGKVMHPMHRSQKIFICNKGKTAIGFSGAARMFDVVQDWFMGGCKPKQKPTDNDFGLLRADIVVDKKHPNGYYIEISEYEVGVDAPLFLSDASVYAGAIGSGEHFALGAMEAGATAEEAVNIASKFDLGTGQSSHCAMLNQHKLVWEMY